MDQPESEGVRLLSFDGGDIRAVSQLIILEEFMRRVEWDRKSVTRILPCDYFHMMAGVGTGGIIVFLLAVLRMGIEEVTEEFIKIWDTVFADVSLDRATRSAKLEDTIKNLLKGRGIEENREMASRDQDRGCRAFVCAVPESNLGMCEKFRTYNSGRMSTNPTIVEAVRATCAIPALFTPVGIESVGCRVSYTTGAYNFNNPAWEAIKEACEYFGRGRSVSCMLSLGCGPCTAAQLSQQDQVMVMKLMASDSELVDRELGWRIGKLDVYHRLSVNQGLDPGTLSPSSPIGNIVSSTKDFLEHHGTIDKVNQCVEASERLGRVTLKEISGLSEPRSTSVHGLPSLSAFFVERPGLIKKMAEFLFRTGPKIQRRMVLSGLGGIGKTQVTISFLLQFLSRFRHVLFIDGSSAQSIESGLVTKIKSLGATYSRTSASEALEVLSNPDHEITRDWVIIYDNVDSAEINIAHYFPSCAFGFIIITTRNPNLGNLAPTAHLKLDVMSKEDAIEVLLRSAIGPSRLPTESEQEHARNIVHALGYLPVALVQAGYFIKLHDCMDDYLSRLQARRPDILKFPALSQLDNHYHGVYATFEVAWPCLSLRAQQFLSILAFVNYTGFPLVLLYRAASHGFAFEKFHFFEQSTQFNASLQLLRSIFHPREDWSKHDIDELVAELEGYSFLTHMKTFMVTISRFHPLVHAWMQDRSLREERMMYQAAAIRILACGTSDADEDIYEFIYPHVTLFSDRLCELHANDQAGMAAIFAHQGEYTIAIALWEGIRRDILSFYHHEDPSYGEADLQLAHLYRDSKEKERLEDAPKLEKKVVEIRRRALGAENPMTLQAMLQLARGRVRDRSGRAETTRILRDTLKIWEVKSGENAEQILQVKEVLALCCDVRESVGLCMEVVQTRTGKDGPDHYATLKAVENLAIAHRRLNLLTRPRPDEASLASTTDMWLSLVTAKTKRRGIDHPDTLDAMEHLALSYYMQKKVDESIKQWQEVIYLRGKVQGRTHKNTIVAMTRLARMYQECQMYTEAEAQWKETVDLTLEAHGMGHEDMLDCISGLASAYQGSERYSESEAQWKVVVSLSKKTRGPSHQDTLYVRRQLAIVSGKSGDYTESEVQWKEITRLTQEAQGLSHPSTLDAMGSLADIYEKAEKYTESEVQWKEVVRLTRKAHGPRHEDTLDAMTALARMYERFKRYEKAQTVLLEALEHVPEDDDSWTTFCMKRSLETIRSILVRSGTDTTAASNLK